MIGIPRRIRHAPTSVTLLLLGVLFAAASIRYPGFFSWFQLTALFSDNATIGLAAIGMTFVILTGGIDLSVGAVIALSSMVFALLVTSCAADPWLAMAAVTALGAAFGAGQGVVVRIFRIPPFLVTLAGMFLARGIALVLTEAKRIDVSGVEALQPAVDAAALGFSVPALAFLCALALAAVVLRFTSFGRTVYAIGVAERSAEWMGLRVGRTTILVYAVSGACAALAGVMHVVGTEAGDASIAFLLELDAIAAVVIGGTLLSGGVGSVGGSALGVMILAIITTAPNYEGNLNTWWTKIAIGALLLAFIGIQSALQASSAPLSRGARRS